MEEYSAQKIYEKIVGYDDLVNKKILEIGCGDGRISSLLSMKSDSLIAIDPDEKKSGKRKLIFQVWILGSDLERILTFPIVFLTW